jgi:sulfite oxidase
MWDKRDDMVVHGRDPYNAEPARHALAVEHLTPVDTFYSRNHGEVPRIEPDQWRLSVDGLVGHPLELGLAGLQRDFEHHDVVATLQCAGNRRSALNQVREIPGEDPWGPCATSTAAWTGVRLADVLDAAGLDADVRHVELVAPDVSALAEPPAPYGSSIPVAKARCWEVLLAWAMNDAPLPPVHGGPVRVLVPGYIGARSVKWVSRITARSEPSESFFQQTAYRLLPPDGEPGPGAGISLASVALNCDVLVPDDGATLPAGTTEVRGYAYAGDDRAVVRVDVSLDAGASWVQADLDDRAGPWTWRLWRTELDLPPGPARISVRAWDSTGATQPESPAHVWNPKGYVNNSWGGVDVTAER